MKTLTLTQPWATLVAIGAKRIETRSWYTNYRGPLAIHAAKRLPKLGWQLLFQEPFHRPLSDFTPPPGWGDLNPVPTGCIIAVVDLVDCLETGEGFVAPPEPELSFGDFSPGRFAWILENVCRLKKPLACRGMLALWEGPDITPEMLEEGAPDGHC